MEFLLKCTTQYLTGERSEHFKKRTSSHSLGSKDGIMVIALASHLRGPGSIQD